MRMPSNSRKTFLSELSAGNLKCLRYQAMPVEWSLMSLRNASSSFQAWGVVMFFQVESSKSTFSAPAGSPTKSFQSELKLYLARGLSGERPKDEFARSTNERANSNDRVADLIRYFSSRAVLHWLPRGLPGP